MYYDNYGLFFFLIFILLMLMILLSIGMFTLLERKILGLINIRKGPNKLGFIGIFQPFSDMIKLFTKEINCINKSNYYLYMISPIFMICIMLILWMVIPMKFNYLSMNLGLLLMLCFLGINVYFLMFSGWSSNSMYSLLGAIRSISQVISYEVCMILIILSLIFLIESFIFYDFIYFQKYFWNIFLMYFLSMIFFIIVLIELNRTPFDLIEGESELVSGFNIDYMSGMFGLIFMSEYGSMIFMMYMYMLLYCGGSYFLFLNYLFFMIMLILLIWIRGTLPRIRYDMLMMLVWKKYLLISLMYLILNIMLKNFLVYF